MIEYVQHNQVLLSIIIRRTYQKDGIEFFTSDDSPQQIGYMKRPKNYVVPPHTHNQVRREITSTHEVLFIKSGKIRVDFYIDQNIYLKSRILHQGDVILLAGGGHGFEMIEESEIIEVKQGPYISEVDKVRFEPVSKCNLVITNE